MSAKRKRPPAGGRKPTELPEFDFGTEQANALATHVMGVKARSVAEKTSADDNADLLPVCMPSRGEEFLGYFIGQQVDRDQGLLAAHYCVVGFGATEFVLAMDARMKVFDKLVKPADRQLEPGELQHIAEHGTPEQRAQVVDCLILIRSQRERTQFYSFPYREVRAGKGWRLEWLHDKQGLQADSDRDGEVIEGRVQDAISRAWESAKGMHELFATGRQAFDLDDAHARVHADMAVLKILSENNITCMYNSDSELKERIIASSTKGGALQGLSALTGEQLDAYLAAPDQS